jgi:aspartyl-tRNA(Asn)/glutamyl-tRNA(Gln) amidotransferase subunit C
MSIALDEVRRIAELARVEFSEQELEALRSELARILEHVDAIEALEARDLAVDAGSASVAPALRDDTPAPSLAPDRALGPAPETGFEHFRVPRVLKG